MRSFLSLLSSLMMLVLVPVVAYAQTAAKTSKKESEFGAMIKDLATTWWLWVGIIVILGLVGLLFYLRNKSED